MNCVICKSGKTRDGTTTATFERGKTTVVIKDVPAKICEDCGEAYIDQRITAQILQIAEGAAHSGVEIEVRHFAA